MAASDSQLPSPSSPGAVRLGIDIGGTKAAIAVGDEEDICATEHYEDWSHGDWHSALDALLARAHALLERVRPGSIRPEAVGISSPGPLDVPGGRIVAAHNIPGWVDVPIVRAVSDYFGCPAALENDANAAALAEWRYGAGRGSRVMLFLTMSSGVGGGIVLDGRLHQGVTHQAGEVGHIPIEFDGRRCSCGLRGCLEAYTGGLALAEWIREEIRGGRSSLMTEAVEGRLERIDAREWVRALRAGDALAESVRDRFLDRLSQGLAILVSTFDPDRIVLGTLIQRNPDLFLEDLRERVRNRVWKEYWGVRIEAGGLGERLPFYAGLAASWGASRQRSGSR